jgi:hypothetical protein
MIMTRRLMTDVALLLLLLFVLLLSTTAAASAVPLSLERPPVPSYDYDDDQQLDSKLQLHYAGEFVVTFVE